MNKINNLKMKKRNYYKNQIKTQNNAINYMTTTKIQKSIVFNFFKL